MKTHYIINREFKTYQDHKRLLNEVSRNIRRGKHVVITNCYFNTCHLSNKYREYLRNKFKNKLHGLVVPVITLEKNTRVVDLYLGECI